MRFAAGSVVTVREVLQGQPWLELPETVEADDGTVLADVAGRLERDDRWWSAWDDWVPSSATMEP